MTFLEERLEIGINYGATYGPRFSTAIGKQSNGSEQRRAMWSQPLILANLATKLVNNAELNYLLNFHATVKGSAIGFRLKDWSDYEAIGQFLGVGNGSTQTWQLCKTYTVGDYSVKRPITKPVSGTVKVYLDGVLQNSNWSINTATGVLTTTLTGAITVDFEFDVPVRFEQDKIDFQFEAYERGTGRKLFTLNRLTCTEIRLEPTIYPGLDPLPDVLPQLDLGYDYGTIGGPEFSTSIIRTASEFEDRKSFWESPLGSWSIGDRTLDKTELNNLIAFFRVARGACVPFLFKDWQTEELKRVRFSEDRLTVSFNAYRASDKQVIFNLGGIGFKRTRSFFILTESSSFNFNLGYPADGDYPRTIYAPQAVLDFVAANGGTIQAYLLSATCDNGFLGIESGVEVWGVGEVTGLPQTGLYFGSGASIDVLIYQRASGPCYFFGTVRWEVWG